MSIFMRLLCVIASLAALTHHREPHRNVEPVEVMLTSGFQCSCTSNDIGASVAKEHHALQFQN
jgi:hypothetical protein